MSHRSPYQRASFLSAAPSIREMPIDEGFEVAFAGRSNCGKSSTLNALTGRRALARTSKTPGRTQKLNVFRLDARRRLVDLPGYGYAQVPENVRKDWQRSVELYLARRRSLAGLVLITDARRPLGFLDQAFLDWSARGRRVHLLLNKADKLGRGAATAALRKSRERLERSWPTVTCQLFSALHGIGLDELWAKLDVWLEVDGRADDDAAPPSEPLQDRS